MLDLRSADKFAAGHIPRALNLPAAKLDQYKEQNWPSFKGAPIVFYSDNQADIDKARALYSKWKAQMTAAIESGDLKTIRKVEGSIRGLRDSVLKGSENPEERRKMELSAENVAFKWLRDTGVLDQCKKLYANDRVGKLSLEKKKGLLGLLGL